MDEENNTPAPEIDPRQDEGPHYRSAELVMQGIQTGAEVIGVGLGVYALAHSKGESQSSEPPPPQDSWESGSVSPPAIDADTD